MTENNEPTTAMQVDAYHAAIRIATVDVLGGIMQHRLDKQHIQQHHSQEPCQSRLDATTKNRLGRRDLTAKPQAS